VVQNNDMMLKVSRLLATGLEILVANAKFSVALATSWSQFRTLSVHTKYLLFKSCFFNFIDVIFQDVSLRMRQNQNFLM